MNWRKSPTTPIKDATDEVFRVTHPYHPLRGRVFSLADYSICWGEPRVFYTDGKGRLKSIPATWTSIGPVDPFVEISAGRSPFRVSDLLDLNQMIKGMKCNANDV